MLNLTFAASPIKLRVPHERAATQTGEQTVDSGSGSQRNSLTITTPILHLDKLLNMRVDFVVRDIVVRVL